MAHTAAIYAPDQGKSAEQLLAERIQRVQDAAEMKQPDRIPIALRCGYFMSDMIGCTHADVYKAEFMQAALEKICHTFQPDYYGSIVGTPGHSSILGDQMTKWPGYGLPDTGSFQYDEHDYMKADEYDALIKDPADFALRVYTPRIFSELKGFGKLPHFANLLAGYYGIFPLASQLADPDVVHAFKKLAEVGEFHQKWFAEQRALGAHMRSLGYPSNPFIGAQLAAPFDFMSDTLRGMHGIFMDMFRRSDKLLAAEEVVCDFQIQYATEYNKPRGMKYVFIPLHRGSDGFMTIEQYKRFYWPQLKRMMLGLINADLVPFVFYEGMWDRARLELLLELPKGKSIGYFQNGNFEEIKELAGQVMCIQGGMHLSTLQLGSVQDVVDRTKYLCKTVGKGGGYIMTSHIGDLEGCKPELIKAWVDATREYGTY